MELNELDKVESGIPVIVVLSLDQKGLQNTFVCSMIRKLYILIEEKD